MPLRTIPRWGGEGYALTLTGAGRPAERLVRGARPSGTRDSRAPDTEPHGIQRSLLAAELDGIPLEVASQAPTIGPHPTAPAAVRELCIGSNRVKRRLAASVPVVYCSVRRHE
jgi:hypothetical protein